MENQVFLKFSKRFWNELTVARFGDESFWSLYQKNIEP